MRRTSFAHVLGHSKPAGASVSALWTSFVTQRWANTRPFDDVVPTLRSLRAVGIKTGLLSNGNTRPENVGLDGLFDFVLVSEFEGIRKPDPVVFANAASDLECAPRDILHVGDDITDDYAASKNAGFQALLLQRNTPYIANDSTASLTTLTELPPLIQRPTGNN